MGSSAKKKKEKQQDFKKPKYKVGKQKAKAANFTDTSFQSRAIVVGQQSLSVDAPDVIQQFKHNLSLASSSRSDKQRREALAYLTTQLQSQPPINPVGTHTLLSKLLPLISDSSTPVRSQLLKLLKALPEEEVSHDTEQALMFIRAGLTHLSADISNDSLAVMEWLLDAAETELITCPGGWVKTLATFCAILGWAAAIDTSGWSSGTRASIRPKDSQTQAKQMQTLAKFVYAGLRQEDSSITDSVSTGNDHLYRVPRTSNAFEYLNLSGPRRAEDGEMYSSREARQQIFHRRFHAALKKGAGQAKQAGGITGRAAARLDQALQEGMGDFEVSTATNTQDLLELW